MIIGIDASRANKDKKTGVEWYAWNIIQEFKQIVPEYIRVVLYTDKPLKGELANLPPNWKEKVLHWPIKRFWTQGRLSLEMIIRPPDVLWVPAHVCPVIHPKQTVMTIHDVAAFRFKDRYSKFEQWYSLWSTKMAANNLSDIIFPSEFTKKEVIEFLKNKSINAKMNTIFHGYNKQFHHELEKDFNSLKSFGINKPYLLFIGRLETKKNTDILVKAFSELKRLPAYKDHQLVLVGKPGFGYEKVKFAMESSPYQLDIVLTGWTEDKHLPNFMKHADVFVFPSQYEGFGIPALEALATGTTLLSVKGHAVEEIVSDAAFLMPKVTKEYIVNTLEKIALEDELKKSKQEKGLKLVKQYSWKKAAKQTLACLLRK